MKTKTHTPTPATTPAMIQAYWQYIITEEQGKTLGRPRTIRRVVEHHIRTGVKPIANRTRGYNELFGL